MCIKVGQTAIKIGIGFHFGCFLREVRYMATVEGSNDLKGASIFLALVF